VKGKIKSKSGDLLVVEFENKDLITYHISVLDALKKQFADLAKDK